MIDEVREACAEDLSLIRAVPGCARVALFGSALHGPLSRATDVDLAIFASDRGAVTEALQQLETTHSLRVATMNGTYHSAPPPTADLSLHVVVLDASNPSDDFMAKSGHLLHDL